MSRAEQPEQMELFPAPPADSSPKSVVTRMHIVWARRIIRAVEQRGPVRVTDLAPDLGIGLGDIWLAAGVARQWRKIDICDGFAVPVPPRKEAA